MNPSGIHRKKKKVNFDCVNEAIFTRFHQRKHSTRDISQSSTRVMDFAKGLGAERGAGSSMLLRVDGVRTKKKDTNMAKCEMRAKEFVIRKGKEVDLWQKDGENFLRG